MLFKKQKKKIQGPVVMLIVQPCLSFQLRIIFREDIGSVPGAFIFLLVELAPFAVSNIYRM